MHSIQQRRRASASFRRACALAVASVLGTIQALNLPARMFLVADLVPRENIMNAIVLNSAMFNSGRIVGPAVAGGIIELTGISQALYFDPALYGVGATCLLVIDHGSSVKPLDKPGMLRDLQSGLHYFWASHVARTVIGIGFCLGFFAFPHMQVLPAFAKEVLDRGPGETGLLLMAAGLGSLAGNLVLAAMGNVGFKNWLLIGASLAFGCTLFAFAWPPWYWLSWGILMMVGLVSMGYVALGTTILQLTTPQEVQGRVMSLWGASAALMFVGALPMGVVAGLVNWPVAMAGGAAMALACVLWLGVWRPTLRQLRV